MIICVARGSWVPYTSLMIKPASLDYLALGTSVLLAVRWATQNTGGNKLNVSIFQTPGS